MVEADELCNRVAIINKGKVLACDSPAALKRKLQHESIFNFEVESIQPVVKESISALPGVARADIFPEDGFTRLELVLSEESAVSEVITEFNTQGLRIRSMQKREPTLEDVFVQLVGARMEEVEDAESPQDQQ
jgi:ABC-2 type transport system ATP-binding protein